uniref:Uncharacterized protein n=1 Tax=Rhizophora mucronata TaxID=61149 RepID=A0A2P2N190_RHIMU
MNCLHQTYFLSLWTDEKGVQQEEDCTILLTSESLTVPKPILPFISMTFLCLGLRLTTVISIKPHPSCHYKLN